LGGGTRKSTGQRSSYKREEEKQIIKGRKRIQWGKSGKPGTNGSRGAGPRTTGGEFKKGLGSGTYLVNGRGVEKLIMTGGRNFDCKMSKVGGGLFIGIVSRGQGCEV